MFGLAPDLELVGSVENGEDVIEAVKRLRPEVVIMDVRLPGIDGIEATRRITERNPAIVVVLVSSQHRSGLPIDLGECGAAGFVRKDELDVRTMASFVS